MHQRHTSLSLLFSSELSEVQQKLLVKSMEKKILPVQLKLVRKKKKRQIPGEFGRESARTSGNRQIKLNDITILEGFCLIPEPYTRFLLLSMFLPFCYFTTRGRKVNFWAIIWVFQPYLKRRNRKVWLFYSYSSDMSKSFNVPESASIYFPKKMGLKINMLPPLYRVVKRPRWNCNVMKGVIIRGRWPSLWFL